MSVLLLELAGPLQSWGDASRFVRRNTRQEPTKSGVLGLLAAAQGRRRTDPVEDLAGLRFGVRVDQAGTLVRDFQTARSADGRRSMPLSYRFYVADAVFLAAVEGDRTLLEGLDEAVRAPAFPLFLGRRSCPPSRAISQGVQDGELLGVLKAAAWRASAWWRARQAPSVDLELVCDAVAGQQGDLVRDHPVSYSPENRQYAWRAVARSHVTMANPEGRAGIDPDFFAALGGA